LAAGLWPGSSRAAEVDAGSFRFVVINDLHYTTRDCGPFFQKLVAQIKATEGGVDLCLLAGDLSDLGRADQLSPLADIFKTLGLPVHAVIGNHDWNGAEDRKPWDDAWPGQINYTFEHKGWQIVALDSTQGLKSLAKAQKPTFDFLDRTLPRLDKKRPTIVFTHMPLGPKVKFRLTNADDVLDRFKEHNVKAFFCGHFHGLTEQPVLAGAVATTNRCCSLKRNNHDGSKEEGYFLCTARDGRIERAFVEFSAA
jgi:3',5'-cyclic AMP phosphodiesterase CpdA